MKTSGGLDMRARANAEVRRILKEHRPAYIDEKTKAELDRLANLQQGAVRGAARP